MMRNEILFSKYCENVQRMQGESACWDQDLMFRYKKESTVPPKFHTFKQGMKWYQWYQYQLSRVVRKQNKLDIYALVNDMLAKMLAV